MLQTYLKYAKETVKYAWKVVKVFHSSIYKEVLLYNINQFIELCNSKSAVPLCNVEHRLGKVSVILIKETKIF